VVATGLTVCVPPFVCRVKVLPSLPVSITWVAFVAVTAKVDEPPGVIDAGLALMPAVGAAVVKLN
jgi:hypothetical protein